MDEAEQGFWGGRRWRTVDMDPRGTLGSPDPEARDTQMGVTKRSGTRLVTWLDLWIRWAQRTESVSRDRQQGVVVRPDWFAALLGPWLHGSFGPETHGVLSQCVGKVSRSKQMEGSLGLGHPVP